MYTPTHLSKWKQPDSYCGAAWPEHFVFLGQNRDSDALTRSNFRSALKALEKLPAWSPPAEVDENGDEQSSRFIIRESHWAVGWVEWIAIHETDLAALEAADEMQAGLDDYPVLDEQDFSELEDEEAQQVWRDCYNNRSRLAYVRKFRSQFDFRDFSDLIGCIRGRYFAGCASELLC